MQNYEVRNPDALEISDARKRECYEIIEDGPCSIIAKMRARTDGRWIVVKSASTRIVHSQEPHDILKEVRLLSGLSHPNIVKIRNAVLNNEKMVQKIYMLFFPTSLVQILSSPNFTTHPIPSDAHEEPCKLQENQFIAIAKSLMFQVLSAVAYLHDSARIAHRDIKPRNIMLTEEGCVKLIDFGFSFKNEPATNKQHDLWPEPPNSLYCKISTRPYKAPELLFAIHRNYNPFPIDLWSLGATFAEFFTSFRLCSVDDDIIETIETDADDDDAPLTPFIVPKNLRIGDSDAHWKRDTLFEETKANEEDPDFAYNIFGIFGTPTQENWPNFYEVLGGRPIGRYKQLSGVPLSSRLPNLPPSEQSNNSTFLLNLLQRFLVYLPERRLRARDALCHPWFVNEDSILLMPRGYGRGGEYSRMNIVDKWQGKSLEEWLHIILSASPV